MADVDTAPVVRGRERTRALLLDAAAQVFAEIGVDAASVEAITERAGFTRGAFYSNFETKDELVLALTAHVSEQKIEAVTQRARDLQASGERLGPTELVNRMLEDALDQKAGVLLTMEIRTRAMRDRKLAEAYLAWQQGMVDRIAAVIVDLGRAYGFTPRLSATDFARLILQTWEDTSANAVIAGDDFETMRDLVHERTARLAVALVDQDEIDPA